MTTLAPPAAAPVPRRSRVAEEAIFGPLLALQSVASIEEAIEIVSNQPFGGNRLSGTGSKAGGPDYLLDFVEPRVITEDTMRHGLVV